jgi:hypothetical protein
MVGRPELQLPPHHFSGIEPSGGTVAEWISPIISKLTRRASAADPTLRPISAVSTLTSQSSAQESASPQNICYDLKIIRIFRLRSDKGIEMDFLSPQAQKIPFQVITEATKSPL